MSNTIEVINFRMINWHAINDSGIIKLDGNTMLCGSSGAGKSTILDALYATIFVNLSCFNKAANKKTKRDLKSYVRYLDKDTDSDGNTVTYRRHGKVISYCVVEFGTRDHHGKFVDKFILGACYTSKNETAPVDYRYFAIRGINIEDLVLVAENKTPVIYESFWSSVQDANPLMSKSYNTQHDGERLFAGMLGFRGRFEDFERVKAFIANNMAFVPEKINDIPKFMSENFLRPIHLDMEKNDELCENYTRFNEMLNEEKRKLEALEEINSIISRIENVEESIRKNDVLKTIADHNWKHDFINRKRMESDEHEAMIEDASSQKAIYDNELLALIKEEAILEQDDETKQINMYRDRIKQHQKDLAFSQKHYQEFVKRVGEMNHAIVDASSIGLCFDIFNFQSVSFNNSNTAGILEGLKNIKSKLIEKEVSINAELAELGKKKQKLDEEINALKCGNFASPAVRYAMESIKKMFMSNGIHDEPRMLYQCLDIKPEMEGWQNAIESMMGNARYNILVDAANYDAAAELIEREKILDATLIDTSSLRDEFRMEDDSVCNYLEYTNTYAEKYMRYRYGRTIAVEKKEDIKDKSKNYLCKSGLAYSHRSIFFYRQPRELVIGEDKIKKLRNEKINERAECIADIDSLSSCIRKINNMKGTADHATAAVAVISKDILHDVETIPAEIERLESEIQKLEDNADFLLRTEQLQKCRDVIRQCKANIDATDSKMISLASEKALIDRQLSDAEEEMNIIVKAYGGYKESDRDAFDEAMSEYEKMRQNKKRTITSIMNACNEENKKLVKKRDDTEVALSHQQHEYCKVFDHAMPYGGMEYASIYKDLYENKIVHGIEALEKKVEEARLRQLKAFETSVVYEFRSAIKTAKRIVSDINKVLEPTDYNGKKFKLSNVRSAPGLERFYDVIMDEDLDVDDNNFTLFSEINQDAINERAELIELVRSNERYRDYRNFIILDIDVTLSANGAKKKLSDSIGYFSGGETQIPFYILMAISMINLYGSGSEKMLRLNLVDEAFDKMDMTSINAMMRFFKMLNFQTVIAAPDSRNDVIGNSVDNIYIMINNKVGRTLVRMPTNRTMLSFQRIDSDASNTSEQAEDHVRDDKEDLIAHDNTDASNDSTGAVQPPEDDEKYDVEKDKAETGETGDSKNESIGTMDPEASRTSPATPEQNEIEDMLAALKALH